MDRGWKCAQGGKALAGYRSKLSVPESLVKEPNYPDEDHYARVDEVIRPATAVLTAWNWH
jgi:hypothetical protein